jgi:putative transposase
MRGNPLGHSKLKIDDIHAYCIEHQQTALASQYIEDSFKGISRNTGQTGHKSVPVERQSPKLGVTFNAESRTVEFSYAVYLDHDDSVIAYYEQPPPVECKRTIKNGVVRRQEYTPDVLVLTTSGPVVVQLKKEQELDGKVKSNRNDWIVRGEEYVDLPAEAAFDQLGLKHIVVSSKNLSQVRTANILHLLQAAEAVSDGEKELEKKCTQAFQRSGVLSLRDLSREVGIEDTTPLLKLINSKILHTDLSKYLLSSVDTCLVVRDRKLLRDDILNEWEASKGLARTSVVKEVPLDRLPPARQLTKGLKHLDALDSGIKNRSTRRWLKKILQGELDGKSRLASVSPKNYLSGNGEPKRPEIVLAYAENCVRDDYGNKLRPTDSTCFRLYKAKAEDWHPAYSPVSKPTFYRLIKGLKQQLAESRGGNRARNAAESPSDVEDRALRPTRPFELASCDHCLVKLYCTVLDANGVPYVDQPWLTVLRDCYTGYVLAFWLSFRPPSKFACSLILRHCLRNHGRLPETIIVDRGSEFRSVHFSSLLAHCGTNLAFRPSGHPRYGQEAETYFKQFKDLWLSGRPGNKVLYKEARSVSGGYKPAKHAVMDIYDLLEELFEFTKWLNLKCSPSQLESSASLMAKGLALFSCSGKKIPYDDVFVVASCIDIGFYEVDIQRGIHIDAFHYWHPKLVYFANRYSKAEVRRNPENPYEIFARIGEEWVPCHSTKISMLALQNPIYQMAEGIRVYDQYNARIAANNDADRFLAKAIMAADERLATKLELIKGDQEQPAASKAPADDPFSALAAMSIESIETTNW